MRRIRSLGIGVICFVALVMALSGCSNSPGDVETVDIDTLDPFMQGLVYARSGDAAKLESIIEANNDIVLETNSDGMTLLHYAATSSQPDTVKLLLDKGADVFAVDADNETPLEAAESEDADEAVLELLRDAEGAM